MTKPTSPGPAASVATVMLSCTGKALLVLSVVAGVVAVISSLPTIFEWISNSWFAWARTLTRNYSTTTYAGFAVWGGLFSALWAACVANKLSETNSDLDIVFGGLAAAIVGFIIIPANCALWAMLPNQAAIFDGSLIEIATRITAIGFVVVSFILGFITIMMNMDLSMN